MNNMYVYHHMNGPVIGCLRLRIEILCYSVQILIDRSNAIYRVCLHSIHTKAPIHPICITNFLFIFNNR